jgi:hypothetical protein
MEINSAIKQEMQKLYSVSTNPERSEQANMSPAAAAAARAWEQSIEPLRDQGIRLGSPAIASTKEGLNCMQQILQESVGSANCIEWSTIRIR